MKKIRLLAAACLMLVLCACSSKEARSVDALMTAIGEVDASCGPVVEYVRNAYEMLSSEEKAQLKNYDLLLSAEAAYVDALIDAIGEVTVQSDGAITAAEEAYASLAADAKPLVAGTEVLHAARETQILKTFYKKISGVWVNEFLGSGNTRIGRGLIKSYGLDETDHDPQKLGFELKEDFSVWCGDTEAGDWELSESRTEVILHTATEQGEQQQVLRILEEGGYTKLVGSVFGNKLFGYVRETDYVAAFHEKYVAAELTQENIHDYVGDPVQIGELEDDNGKKHHAYIYPSAAYDSGLVYLGSSCIFQVNYVHGGSPRYLFQENPVLFHTRLKMKDVAINTEARLSGEIYYVKNDYVAHNDINENGLRVLELTNGAVLVFDRYDEPVKTFWNRVTVDYSDHKY